MDPAILIVVASLISLIVLWFIVPKLLFGKPKVRPEKILLGFRINEKDGQPTCGTSDRVYSRWVDEQSPRINFAGKGIIVFGHRILATEGQCKQILYIDGQMFATANLPVPPHLKMDFIRPADDSPAMYIILGKPRDRETFRRELGNCLLQSARETILESLEPGKAGLLSLAEDYAIKAGDYFHRWQDQELWYQAVLLRSIVYAYREDTTEKSAYTPNRSRMDRIGISLDEFLEDVEPLRRDILGVPDTGPDF
ncbi:MAG: hypothetical protein HQ530_01980 [Parcubacteria group bacterium]|nr:hypothetical protein [Parcubacteria group bacterium]